MDKPARRSPPPFPAPARHRPHAPPRGPAPAPAHAPEPPPAATPPRHDLEIGTEPVLGSRLLERVVGSEQRRWPGVAMHLELPGELDPVIGEDIYVEQVIRNLVGNAAKYSPQGTVVDILTEQDEDEVTVRVLDRGP